MGTYTFLCLGVSIDRLIAVYFPIGYSAKRPKFLKAWVIGCILPSILFDADTVVFAIFGVYNDGAGLLKVLFFLFCFFITGCDYVCIIYKLWKAGPKTSNQVVPLSFVQSTSKATAKIQHTTTRCELDFINLKLIFMCNSV